MKMNKNILQFISACIDFLKMKNVPIEDFETKFDLGIMINIKEGNGWCAFYIETENTFLIQVCYTSEQKDGPTFEDVNSFRDWLFGIGFEYDEELQDDSTKTR